MITLIERAQTFIDRTAIISDDQSYTYGDLERRSAEIATDLLNGKEDLEEARIAFLLPPGFDYVATQWAIWRAGGVAVPLCEKHPPPSLQYVIEDTSAKAVIYAGSHRELLEPIFYLPETEFRPFRQLGTERGTLPDVAADRRAMILYTSGTTGRPKGVVTTHANIEAQIRVLVEAWQWRREDHILNILPLHHVHGIINVLSCALWSGACCEFLPRFSDRAVFDCFLEGRVSVFMAVPTIYYKLIAHYRESSADRQGAISEALARFRLMVSGSAALPVSVLEQWREISGHTLLERYGMTEMGMAVSNPYDGERRPGHIGQPLPGVSLRVVDEAGGTVQDGEAGEIQIKGENVFLEYWDRPDATSQAFTPDGWFRTGDIATCDGGSYRILGRNSVDIIKSGGYKISALEVEEVLRSYPAIQECAVVGIPDEEYGEVIGAGIVVRGKDVDLQELNEWLRGRLPGYKVPRRFVIREELPRNVMGKVTKQELKKQFA